MTKFIFLQRFNKDTQVSLLNNLKALWTHSSTAIEGNTLSLSETKLIIEEGLTISGKPLKDCQEVIGHANAIEVLFGLIEKEITAQEIFTLHKIIQTETVADIYKPQGAWKNQPNGTYTVDSKGHRFFINYASPADVAVLMQEWFAELKRINKRALTASEGISAYCKLHMGFIHIHPFWDGNGRLARLLSNIPLLKSGHPPLFISQEDRQEYIQILASYQMKYGMVTAHTGVWPKTNSHNEFEEFCICSYATTVKIVEQTKRY